MKKLIYPFKGFVLLAFALTPLLGMAIGGENVEKKRTISKTYSVTSSDKLSIENSFGNVVVSTWDKNEIQVDVEIGVRASSEEKAQQMLDQIKVTDKQSGQLIFFKTDIGNMGSGKENKNYDGNDRRFYIDYKISMPSRNPLSIENSFGKVNIPDFAGPASLTSKFGELTTGKLAGAKLVQVEFGRADIGVLNNADVVFKFNSRSNIAGLGGNAKVHVEFCSQVNLTLDNSLTELTLSESYSSINLKAPSNLSAHFDVYTNFGSFKNRTGFNIAEDKDDDFSGPKFDKNYSGSAGNGAAKIKIKSSFGTVRVVNVDDKTNDKEESHEDKDKDNDKDDEKVDL